MHSNSARFVAVVLAVAFVVMGMVHATHAHAADEASATHPACTTCQFHAPAAGQSGIHGTGTGPGPGTRLHAPSPDTRVTSTPARKHASRAPPRHLAI
ncbi:MAG: hypothetical protein OEX18_07165 [Candidatus Krumholzibacteria bacterium]|nr:hypothetical protein [Candidatus Krumholzibacteria bacterium]MDH4337047.1 hypothetical protein [Candidatus Krumholzibacteria bacterium]MDH5268584.1 hypothetical protein [Candidatus Krumholzibacteria bacterium]